MIFRKEGLMGDLPAFAKNHDLTSQKRFPVPEYPDEELVAFTDHLWRRLCPGERVLDAGCGRGRNAFYLTQAGFRVHAMDVSSIALSIAAARSTTPLGSSICFQVADLLHLPYSDDSFAAAVCVHVLSYHSFDNLQAGVRELRRVLRPGGYLYFDLFSTEDAAYGGGQELEPDTFLNPHGALIHFSPRAEIPHLLQGFQLERVLHIEVQSVLGSRAVWGIWAIKKEDPSWGFIS